VRHKDIHPFRDRLAKACGDNFRSLVLHGSAVAGDFSPHFSDINLVLVLATVAPPDLAAVEPAFRWWTSRGHRAPTLIAAGEVAAMARCFPIEFHDLLRAREVVHGDDPFAGLEPDSSYHRAEVEQELRSKLLRLRQRAACVWHDQQLLMRLMVDSVPSFLTLARHAVALAGAPMPASRDETIAAAAEQLRADIGVFSTVAGARDGAMRGKSVDSRALFAQYLAGVESLLR
jgi:predicted nucleotidyltransferase